MNLNKEISLLLCDQEFKGICTVQGEPAKGIFNHYCNLSVRNKLGRHSLE